VLDAADLPPAERAAAERPTQGVLSGRVLEVGERVGTAAAGLALAALGGDVVQVRLPGRRVPAPEATYYDRGRTVVAPGTAHLLAAPADVVVTDLDEAALETAGIPSARRHLRGGERPQVLVSIRSLGREGPSAGFRMTDLTEWAAGGLATVTRRPRLDDPERYVPVLPPGFQPQALAGLAAAAGVFAARRWAHARRQPVVVDVSVQEVMAATLHSIVPNFVWNGHVLGHPGTPTTALGLYLPAADGDVYIRTVEAHQWEKLVAWIGHPDWAALGTDPTERYLNRTSLQALVGEWTATQKSADLVAEGQRRKVPIAVPRSLAEVLAWQHLRARGAWVPTDLEGAPGEVPRLPVLEPARWPASRPCTVAQVAARWGDP
jgi:crotonobetainyl-CoA:carnitine CoA-transferase CaiB-like acyl-CoA transferase